MPPSASRTDPSIDPEKLPDGRRSTRIEPLLARHDAFGLSPSTRASSAETETPMSLAPAAAKIRAPLVPSPPASTFPLALGRAPAARVKIWMTPPTASDPYSDENGPRTTSIRSTFSVPSEEKS